MSISCSRSWWCARPKARSVLVTKSGPTRGTLKLLGRERGRGWTGKSWVDQVKEVRISLVMSWNHLEYHGSITLCLVEDEVIETQQVGVGLYNGDHKVIDQSVGTVYLTNLRLLYLDSKSINRHSAYLNLDQIIKTSHYRGFLSSSPKITITTKPNTSPLTADHLNQPSLNQTGATVCPVCGMSNQPSNTHCNLCGIKLINSTSTNQQLEQARYPSPPTHSVGTSSVASGGTPPLRECLVCTYLNHPDLSRCEICNNTLTPTTNTNTHLNPTQSNTIRLSFRQSGDKAFYDKLNHAIANLKLQQQQLQQQQQPKQQTRSRGIDGLVKDLVGVQLSREDEINSALVDLNSLVNNANQMISLARTMKSTTTDQVQHGQDRPLASILGGASISEQDLVSELVELLVGAGNLLSNGLIGLDSVWCAWNRARGIALVSPGDFRLACQELGPASGGKVSLKTFQSGVAVLHTQPFAIDQVANRILNLLRLNNSTGLSSLSLAQSEGLSIEISVQLLTELHHSGLIVCDQQEQTTWHPNYFDQSTWDGQQ